MVTDALDMGAIVNGFGAGESAVQAFLAGADLLLMPDDLDDATKVVLPGVGSFDWAMSRLNGSGLLT